MALLWGGAVWRYSSSITQSETSDSGTWNPREEGPLDASSHRGVNRDLIQAGTCLGSHGKVAGARQSCPQPQGGSEIQGIRMEK